MRAYSAHFQSMLEAISYVMWDKAGHYFTLTPTHNRQTYFEDRAECAPVDAYCASTFVEYAVGSDNVVCVSVDSDSHHGYVLAHYTNDRKIVRFVGVRQ